MKKHNFSAGPCILPEEVLQQASKSVIDFNNDDLSLLEISHRSKPFVDVIENAKLLTLELLGLENKGYKSIDVEKIPNKGLGRAINDRLDRASKY